MQLIEDSGASQLTITKWHADALGAYIQSDIKVAMSAAGGTAPRQLGLTFGNESGQPLTVIRCAGTPWQTVTRVEAIVLAGDSRTALLGGLEPALHCASVNHLTCKVDYKPLRCSKGDLTTTSSLPIALIAPPNMGPLGSRLQSFRMAQYFASDPLQATQ
jgi:hypothetical protein